MKKRSRKIDPLPESFGSIEEAAEFWDTHDTTDYLEFMKPVDFEVRLKRHPLLFKLKGSLAKGLTLEARRKKMSAETLLNNWVAQRLSKLGSFRQGKFQSVVRSNRARAGVEREFMRPE
jgi:hypothetical protein